MNSFTVVISREENWWVVGKDTLRTFGLKDTFLQGERKVPNAR